MSFSNTPYLNSDIYPFTFNIPDCYHGISVYECNLDICRPNLDICCPTLDSGHQNPLVTFHYRISVWNLNNKISKDLIVIGNGLNDSVTLRHR